MEARNKFIAAYCASRSWSREQFASRRVALHCTCEDGGAVPHWCAIPKGYVREHLEHEQVLKGLRELNEEVDD